MCIRDSAKAVPVNPYNFRNPKTGMALTALAGPVSNLLMAVLAVGLYRLLSFFITSAYVNSILYWMLILVFASVNVGLAVFNLLPKMCIRDRYIPMYLHPEQE